MRLSDQDAGDIAARLADDSLAMIEDILLHELDPEDAQVLGDDLYSGYRRVLLAAEIYA